MEYQDVLFFIGLFRIILLSSRLMDGMSNCIKHMQVPETHENLIFWIKHIIKKHI